MMNRNPFGQANPGMSFLPEDIAKKRLERRTSAICLTLFFITMFCVAGAFFVTNQRWSTVKEEQRRINSRYMQAAQDIDLLKSLEDQRNEMLAKAELTTALIERVPRSILTAELVNRMPDHTTLLELTLKSKRETKPVGKAKAPPADAPKKPVSLAKGRAAAKKDVLAEPPPPQAPKYDTALTIIGAASTHTEVSQYLASLQTCPLLRTVELKFSEATIINDQEFIKFRIEAEIRPDADARRIEPLRAPRLRLLGGAEAGADSEEEKDSGGALKSLWGGKKEK